MIFSQYRSALSITWIIVQYKFDSDFIHNMSAFMKVWPNAGKN
jgi:hypothetical protein